MSALVTTDCLLQDRWFLCLSPSELAIGTWGSILTSFLSGTDEVIYEEQRLTQLMILKAGNFRDSHVW
jgi:hypothetical protein